LFDTLDASEREMADHDITEWGGHRLLNWGFALFLLGLLIGFAVPALENPRMGLASHLQGITNGMFLVILGLVWPRLKLSVRAFRVLYWLAIYGTFANWVATALAAVWGAGSMMAIASAGYEGTAVQESLIMALLFSLSLAMIGVVGLVLWGLRRGRRSANLTP
jgi:hydroxylaminobenzene mutase